MLLLCARAVRGLLVGPCLMHVCAHYSMLPGEVGHQGARLAPVRDVPVEEGQ